MTLEEENKSLKEELQVLYGKLGTQGKKIHAEDKYRELQTQLYDAYSKIEALESQSRNLRDDFANTAMQGVIACHVNSHDYPDREEIAKVAYSYANAMMIQRDINE